MKTSDDGTIRIKQNEDLATGRSYGTLKFDGIDQVAEYATGTAGIVQFLEERGASTTYDGTQVQNNGVENLTYDVFTVGDHTLYIDQELNSDAV